MVISVPMEIAVVLVLYIEYIQVQVMLYLISDEQFRDLVETKSFVLGEE